MQGRKTLLLLAAAVMMPPLKANAEKSGNVSGNAYIQSAESTWSGEEVELLVQELEAEAEKAVDEAYGAGYESGYRKGIDDASVSVKKRTFRERTADFAFGFLAGAGTCMAVGITVRLQ